MIRAEMDEILRPGQSYSRRPRIRALSLEVIGKSNSDTVVCALCRKLIAAGHNPNEPMEIYRGSTLSLHVRSIGEAAKLTVLETGHGPKFVKLPRVDLKALWEQLPRTPDALNGVEASPVLANAQNA
jgi:hypothetical protein